MPTERLIRALGVWSLSLAVLPAATGCRSMRSEVPPGRQVLSSDGKPAQPLNFGASPNPATGPINSQLPGASSPYGTPNPGVGGPGMPGAAGMPGAGSPSNGMGMGMPAANGTPNGAGMPASGIGPSTSTGMPSSGTSGLNVAGVTQPGGQTLDPQTLPAAASSPLTDIPQSGMKESGGNSWAHDKSLTSPPVPGMSPFQ